jgi:hypothetical protein
VISGVFTAEEVDGVADKGSGYTTMFDVHTPGGIFENVPDMPVSLIKLFPWQKSQIPIFGLLSSARFSDNSLKRIFLHYDPEISFFITCKIQMLHN